MEMFEFYIQDLHHRAEIAFNKGKHISTRQRKHQRVELYYVDKVFIEVCYKKDTNELSAVRAFTDLDLLEPYL
jgi:hypothetical protein